MKSHGKEKAMKVKKKLEEFLSDDAGITSIEIVLILVVLIALIVIFKDQITAIVEKAFASITSNTDSIVN